MNDYILVLGSHQLLSLAEIFAYFGEKAEYELLSKECLWLRAPAFEAADLMQQLAGVIKIARVWRPLDKALLTDFGTEAAPLFADQSTKAYFGFSAYGLKLPVNELAMSLKQALKAGGRPVRWVVSKEPVLSSVVVEQNHLVDRGREFIAVKRGQQSYLALTEAVQPFKQWSARDYGRPARDDASGMLPPKVARMMLNLAQPKPDQPVWDPFCGSGTVLMEAALAGCRYLYGSDISPKAVDDTEANMLWLEQRYHLNFECDLATADALQSANLWPGLNFTAIVFEGFLGPQRGRIDWPQTMRELSKLYSQVLALLYRRLAPGQRLVAALPYIPGARPLALTLDLSAYKQPRLWPKGVDLDQRQLSPAGRLLYGRAGQRVWRELVVLEK